MKRNHKVLFGSAPKYIRKQMCLPDPERAVMSGEVKRPKVVEVGGKMIPYMGP